MQTPCPESSLRTAPNWPKIQKMTIVLQFSDMTLTSIFFDVVLFFLPSLVTGSTFMSKSSLVLKLWQFSFIGDWPKTRKSEILTSAFCPISRNWGELSIPNLALIFLIECYWMLQNSRITAFTVFKLLRENQLGGGGCKITPPPTRLGLKASELPQLSSKSCLRKQGRV